jgi:16S rRNA (cytidine1402-2'-O)-methyltransferase
MLHIIPTPIWNKDDVTIRAINLFNSLTYFICEDSRTFRKLLRLHDIEYKDKKFYSLTSFTDPWKIAYYTKLIETNEVWLVSDAGVPWLSDPWKSLIKLCWENDLKFEVLPWASALIPAVVWTFWDTSEFVFMGFLPTKKWKQTKIKEIISFNKPVFIYESVHRIEKNLKLFQELWFKWKVCVFRELSKMYEQKIYGTIDEILLHISNGTMKLKWEFVIGFLN